MKKFIFLGLILMSKFAFANIALSADIMLGALQDFVENGGLFHAFLSTYRGAVEGSGLPGFCIICPLFKTFYQVLANVSTAIAGSLEVQLLRLLAIGTLFYLVIKFLIAFINFKKIKAAQLFSDIGKVLARVIIAAILLSNIRVLLDYALTPFLTLVLGFVKDQAMAINGDVFMFQDALLKCPGISCEIANGKYLSETVCHQIMESICFINAATALGVAIGLTLLCYCVLTQNMADIIPGLIIGGGISVAYFYIMFMYPFRFFDAILRLGFVIALLPFFVVAWVFKTTRNYVRAAWLMFLNAALSLGFLILIMSWILELLRFGLNGHQTEVVKLLAAKDAAGAFEYLLHSPQDLIATFVVMYVASQLLNLTETLIGYLTDTQAVPPMGYRQDGQMIGIGEQVFQRLEDPISKGIELNM